jgi:hypothetical protein
MLLDSLWDIRLKHMGIIHDLRECSSAMPQLSMLSREALLEVSKTGNKEEVKNNRRYELYFKERLS